MISRIVLCIYVAAMLNLSLGHSDISGMSSWSWTPYQDPIQWLHDFPGPAKCSHCIVLEIKSRLRDEK